VLIGRIVVNADRKGTAGEPVAVEDWRRHRHAVRGNLALGITLPSDLFQFPP
jgi:hypothetical protein